MNNYEKPTVLVNGEIAEGVFAASGGAIGITYKVNYQGQETHVHTVKLADPGYDITGTLTITYTFDQPIVVSRSGNEWQSSSVSDSVLKVVYSAAIADKKNDTNNPSLDQFTVAGTIGRAELLSAVGSES